LNHFFDIDIEETDTFLKSVKKLRKRFQNIDDDYRNFAQSIKAKDDLVKKVAPGY